MNMGYALILGIRKKQKKYNICVKDFRYSLLVGSIQLIINELILVEKLVPFPCHLCKKIDCANTLTSFLKTK